MTRKRKRHRRRSGSNNPAAGQMTKTNDNGMAKTASNKMKQNYEKITWSRVWCIFISITAYFCLLLLTVYPFCQNLQLKVNPIINWIILGYFLFIPMFFVPLFLVKPPKGIDLDDVFPALGVKPMNKKAWEYALGGAAVSFLGLMAILGISFVMNTYFDWPILDIIPWFMELHPIVGFERLLFFTWLPMFFFNVVGEEFLWRGYLQHRMPLKHPWILCSIMWTLFHIPFGYGMILALLPVTIVIPYIYDKIKNTSIGMIIHAIYNGPLFALVLLGIIN